MKGIIKKFIEAKAFGVVETEMGKDAYFNWSSFQLGGEGSFSIANCSEGDKVEFDIEENIIGDFAINIRRVENGKAQLEQ